jgi:hypothetical protein
MGEHVPGPEGTLLLHTLPSPLPPIFFVSIVLPPLPIFLNETLVTYVLFLLASIQYSLLVSFVSEFIPLTYFINCLCFCCSTC